MPEAQAQPLAFSPADLDQLAELVENEKCALILGPLASCDKAGRPLRHLLAEEIAEAFHKKSGKHLPAPTNLGLCATAFLGLPNMARTSLEIIVRDFYKQHTEPSAVLLEASRLPFRLVFTGAHDELLQKAFATTRRRNAEAEFYRFRESQPDNIHNVPPDWTYIYQLFGRVADKINNSLVLTVGDQLTYIDSVQSTPNEKGLPKGLQNAMLDCEAFLFVGFDFEHWYLKVLFHILKFSEKARLVFGLPEGASAQMSPATAEFFGHQFKFSFLSDQPLHLLQGIRERIESPKNTGPTASDSQRSLLFILHPNEKDEATRQRIGSQLANARRTHFLRELSINDFEAGDEKANRTQKIREASVILLVLSADFVADDELMEKAELAIAQASPSVVVAAIYAREMAGATDFLRQRIPALPAATVPLSFMQDDVGTKMVAERLEKLIETLPKP